jgi:hypothetical protein
MSIPLRPRSDGRCATAGCERAHDDTSPLCRPCQKAHALLPAVGTTDAPSLFDAPRAEMIRASLPEHLAAHPIAGKAATSRKAAAAIESSYSQRQYLIHQHLKQLGAHGATRPELAAALGVPVNSINSACNTLYRRGLIGSNPDDERADPQTGNACAVLVDEAYVARWRGQHRRERSAHYDDLLRPGAPAGECLLVHPRTGAVMTQKEADALRGADPACGGDPRCLTHQGGKYDLEGKQECRE